MVGPGFNIVGGIRALCESIVPALQKRVDLSYFKTVADRPSKDSNKLSVKNILLAISQYSRFIAELITFSPDIVHLHTSQGMGWLKDIFYVLVGKLFGCRVIVHVHAYSYDIFYGDRNGFTKLITRKIFRLSDAIVSVSEKWRESLGSIIAKERIFAFRNCIRTGGIVPGRKMGRSADAVFLGSVGPRKGAFDLIEAMRALRARGFSFKVYIAGDEEHDGDMDKIRKMVADYHLGDYCYLVGAVNGRKKSQLLESAGMFVLPSYDEGLPIAILEAMAAGLAIVTTPVGGIPEVVKEGYNGLLAPPGAIDALTEKLAALQQDAQLRTVMGRRSREMAVRELDVYPYVDKLLRLYRSLATTRPEHGLA
jgi:glycosyltransferase involved in cell wall biosynthesis